MACTLDQNELRVHACVYQGLVQVRAVAVGHEGVSIAVDDEERWVILVNIGCGIGQSANLGVILDRAAYKNRLGGIGAS